MNLSFDALASDSLDEIRIGGNLDRAKVLSNLAIGAAIMELAEVMREREGDRRNPVRNC